jgi:hypothetical protein
MFRDSIREEIVSYCYKMAVVIPLFSSETISNQIKAITNYIWYGLSEYFGPSVQFISSV